MIQQFVWQLRMTSVLIFPIMAPVMVQIFGESYSAAHNYYSINLPVLILHLLTIIGCLVVTLMTRSPRIKTRSGPTIPMEQSLVWYQGNVWNLWLKKVVYKLLHTNIDPLLLPASLNTVGSNVQLNSCTGADNQRWMYDKTTGEIKGLKSGLCIDVGSTASCKEQPWSGYPYCNTQLDPLTRAKDLVDRMEAIEMVI